MKINKQSDKTLVMRTRCERCGVEGYIFPDQLRKEQEYAIGDWWYSKCCNGRRANEKMSKCLHYISPDRAMRLQNIRRRTTTMEKENTVANF